MDINRSSQATASTRETTSAPICIMGIGGLDPSGGAGLPADARAASAFGVHLCGIATAVIAQNTRGVAAVEAVSGKILQAQLLNLLGDITPRAVKIGMLPSVEAVEIVVAVLSRIGSIPIVLDTVFAPSSGPLFSGRETVSAIVKQLLPLCEVVTPNIPEAAQLCGVTVTGSESAEEAARGITALGARNVLIKGGHAEGSEEAIDWLFDGDSLNALRASREHGYEVRGTGCLLASAIAAQLARGVNIQTAARNAKGWLREQIATAHSIGGGCRVAALPF